MAESAKIAAWDGSVPVLVSLGEEDLAVPEAPAPVMSMVRRRSWLGPELESIVGSLLRCAVGASAGTDEGGSRQWWLVDEISGREVRCMLPCGVAYDLSTISRTGDVDVGSCVSGNGRVLPWRLVLRVTGCKGPACSLSGRQTYFHSLKSALVGTRGTPGAFFALSSSDQGAIWDGVVATGDSRGYSAHEERIDKLLKTDRIPLKILWLGDDSANPPIRPCIVPEEEVEFSLLNIISKALKIEIEQISTIVAQGIVLDGERLSIKDAYNSLRHPDGFLYIIATKN